MSIGRKIAHGATLMVLFRVIERGLGFVSVLILARLLVPADFGLVAMATALIGLIELMGAFGFDVAIIRLETAERRHYDSAWTLNVAVGLVIAVLLAAAAWPVASFYDEPRLPAVVLVLALGSVVGSLENVGVIEFRRNLDFKREFRFQVIKKFAGFVVTVPLAFWLRNYWALVAGMLASRVVATAWSYVVHPFRPRLSFAAAQQLFAFTRWLLVNNLLGFFKERGADFIVGRISGRAALGLYSVGYEIANLPTSELVAPINRAAYPGYARLAGDTDALRGGLVKVIGAIAVVSVPAGIGILAVAPLACEVLLGAKWLGAIPVIEIIALHGVITALQTNMFAAFLALGRPDLAMWLNAGHVAVLLPLAVLLTHLDGIRGTALACLITTALFAPIDYGVLLWKLRLSARAVAACLWRPLVAALPMLLAARLIGNALAASAPALVALAAAIAAGAAAYLAVLALLWQLSGRPEGGETFLLERLRTVIGPRLGMAKAP